MTHIPTRMCVICRQRAVKKELTRYILTDTGKCVPDIHQKLPGRGWYVCSHITCTERFMKYRPHKNTKRKILAYSTSHAETKRAQGGNVE